jgi:ketosteroid isomerase-like protein
VAVNDEGIQGGWKEHPNARILRDFFRAFGTADEARLGELLTQDFVWHFPGYSPIGGDWRGVEGLLAGIRAIAMTLGDGHNGFELLEVMANEHSAVSVHRDFYEGPDNHFDMRFVIHARIEDGRMAEVWEIPFDLHESDRYFGQQGGLIAWRIAASERAG